MTALVCIRRGNAMEQPITVPPFVHQNSKENGLPRIQGSWMYYVELRCEKSKYDIVPLSVDSSALFSRLLCGRGASLPWLRCPFPTVSSLKWRRDSADEGMTMVNNRPSGVLRVVVFVGCRGRKWAIKWR